jgi:hypothetical protein
MQILQLTLILAGCTDTGTTLGPDDTAVITGQTDSGIGTSTQTRDSGADTEEPADISCDPLADPTGTVITVTVADGPNLASIVDQLAPGDTLSFQPGTYSVAGDIWVRTEGVTLRGATGQAADVVLDASYSGGSVLVVTQSNVTVTDMTFANAWYHGVHVRPDSGATETITGVRLHRIVVHNAAEQAIKVNQEDTAYVDQGELSCSTLLLDNDGRSEVRNGCYTGGLDMHRGQGWVIRDNHVEGFWCDQGLAEHGLHLWRQNAGAIIERNTVVNCARGIGLGLANSSDGADREHPGYDCPDAFVDDYGGMIRNNTVFADDPRLFNSTSGFDSGIGLWSACESTVIHNTVWSTQPPFSSIEWRFDGTTAVVKNNLVSHTLKDRGVSSIDEAGNLAEAVATLLVDAAAGDLHLSPGATGAIDAGVTLPKGWADTDHEGDDRDDSPDIGADEVVVDP